MSRHSVPGRVPYPLKRALVLVVLCPVVYVAGCLIAKRMPDGLNLLVLIIFLTAAAACPVLALLGVAKWAADVPKRLQVQHRQRRGLCAECGYDLRATPGRCPECGTIPAAPPAR